LNEIAVRAARRRNSSTPIITKSDSARAWLPNWSPTSRVDGRAMSDHPWVPTYLLSRFTRKHVTVALGGDGGDEIFCRLSDDFGHRMARPTIACRNF